MNVALMYVDGCGPKNTDLFEKERISWGSFLRPGLMAFKSYRLDWEWHDSYQMVSRFHYDFCYDSPHSIQLKNSCCFRPKVRWFSTNKCHSVKNVTFSNWNRISSTYFKLHFQLALISVIWSLLELLHGCVKIFQCDLCVSKLGAIKQCAIQEDVLFLKWSKTKVEFEVFFRFLNRRLFALTNDCTKKFLWWRIS